MDNLFSSCRKRKRKTNRFDFLGCDCKQWFHNCDGKFKTLIRINETEIFYICDKILYVYNFQSKSYKKISKVWHTLKKLLIEVDRSTFWLSGNSFLYVNDKNHVTNCTSNVVDFSEVEDYRLSDSKLAETLVQHRDQNEWFINCQNEKSPYFYIIELSPYSIELKVSQCDRLIKKITQSTVIRLHDERQSGEFCECESKKFIRDHCFIIWIQYEHMVSGFLFQGSKIFHVIQIRMDHESHFCYSHFVFAVKTNHLIAIQNDKLIHYHLPEHFFIDYKPHIFSQLKPIFPKELNQIVYEYFDSFWSGFDEPVHLSRLE
jgi:hypothetical protein